MPADPDLVIAAARGWLGTPYHDQASVKGAGCDCLGLARGVALLVPGRCGIEVAEYSSTAVKKAVVGVGHADKVQVQAMVQRLLPGVRLVGPDAADALAVALCHGHHLQTRRRWDVEAATR